jgi:hypothetical protein
MYNVVAGRDVGPNSNLLAVEAEQRMVTPAQQPKLDPVKLPNTATPLH